MIFKKKPVKKELVNKKKFTCQIILRDGRQAIYNAIYSINSGITCMNHYRKFYNWFYLRPSEYYTFRYQNGATILVRSEIKQIEFKTEIIQEEV